MHTKESILESIKLQEIFIPEAVVRLAEVYIGFPSGKYSRRQNGRSPDGFDCSGFITFILEQLGIEMPENTRTCNEYFDRDTGVLVHYGFQQQGDLVFFSRNGSTPTHMGIMSSQTEYIHAPGVYGTQVEKKILTQSVIIPNMRRPYDVVYGTNPIGFKRLAQQAGRWKRFY